MFQTHCYDAWLGGAARNSTFFMWSQLGGTFPAPLFLFLAGISFAMVTDKLLQKGLKAGEIARITIRRGAEIFALGLLFRIQEFAISLGWAPWSDLFRVDILNTIGVSMMLMGVVCWVVLAIIEARRSPGRPRPGWAGEGTRPYASLVTAAVLLCSAISAFTPLLWTTWQPKLLSWPIETYVNGVHNLGAPQPWLFPIFPWTAFAFAGLACGRCGNCFDLWCKISGLATLADLSHVRFLAHQSNLLRNPPWVAAAPLRFCLCLVPMGSRAMGIQPDDSTRQN